MTILKSILFILLFIPGVIIAQDTEEDTTLVTDSLTAEYDSIISKAATSLSRQEFDQAKEYFKEASLLMPGEFYPRKMMIAVESSKQVFLKRQQRDEALKRKAEINRLLERGLTETMNKNYDSARVIYSRVLTLDPVESIKEFATKKIATIDLALGKTAVPTEVGSASPSVAARDQKKLPVPFEMAANDVKVVTQVDAIMEKAVNAISNKDYQSARTLYSQVLSLTATKAQKDFAQSKIVALNEMLQKAPVSTTKQAEPIAATSANIPPPANSVSGNRIASDEKAKTDSADKVSRENEQKRIAAKALEEQKRQAELQRKAQVDALLDKAALAMVNKNYETARGLYNQALTLNPSPAAGEFAKNKLAAIDVEIEQAKKATAEKNLIAASRAKEVLEKARKDSADKLARENEQKSIAAKAAEAQRQQADLQRKVQIDGLMDKAASAMSNENYESARLLYKQVLASNPSATQAELAQRKLAVIDLAIKKTQQEAAEKNVIAAARAKDISEKAKKDSVDRLARENEQRSIAAKAAEEQKQRAELQRKAQIDELMDKAAVAMLNETYEDARVLFNQVLALNPSQAQVEFTRRKLGVIDLALKKARQETTEKNAIAPSTAKAILEKPKTDSSIKPASQNDPKIVALNAGQNQKQEDNLQRSVQIDNLIKEAIRISNDRNWSGAMALYQKALALNPTQLERSFIARKMDEINTVIKRDQSKIAAKAPAPTKETVAIASVTNPFTEAPVGGSRNRSTIISATPVSNATPDNMPAPGNSNSSPTKQVYDATDPETTRQNAEFVKRVMSEKPSLNITDINNDVKITCQNITFNGNNTFIKFLVQNLSPTTEFTVGNLQLTYIKNYGILKKLNPNYISDFPVVLPKKELTVVYVAQTPLGVQADEVFVFEMQDRLKQVRLSINLPAQVYATRTNN